MDTWEVVDDDIEDGPVFGLFFVVILIPAFSLFFALGMVSLAAKRVRRRNRERAEAAASQAQQHAHPAAEIMPVVPAILSQTYAAAASIAPLPTVCTFSPPSHCFRQAAKVLATSLCC